MSQRHAGEMIMRAVYLVHLFFFFLALFFKLVLPLFPHLPWCLSCSGARECVRGSETAFPPLPHRTLTGPFECDKGKEREERDTITIGLPFRTGIKTTLEG